MEYQSRGVVHYHIFFSASFVHSNGVVRPEWLQSVVRRGRATSILRGVFDAWCVGAWVRSVGDTSDEFTAFQQGGICEMLRTPDAAARYVAKECSKREQKALPEGIDGGNRWWWLSPEGQPRPEATGVLFDYPLAVPLSRIFDKSQLAANIGNLVPVGARWKAA
jgi:hypothetical protein